MIEQYKNKKVFITGHTGFKGAWLLAILHQVGAVLKGYALEPESTENIYDIIHGNTLCQSVIADIRDQERLTKELLSFQPDYIFHLAAQPLVRRSYKIPSETFEVNVIGTSYLLEALLKLNEKCSVVVITTDKVYANLEQDIQYAEDNRLGGHDPYSTSKACAELVVESFRKSFFEPAKFAHHKKAIATARAGNVIGGGDFSTDRIIPDLVRALQANKVLKIRNPSAIRPWQHVLEPLLGYLKLGLLLDQDPVKYSKAYNFGPNESDQITVEELIRIAIGYLGKGSYEVVKQENFHEAGILKLDIELAKTELDWHPILNSIQAIEKTLGWYQSPDPKTETFRQVIEYLKI